jgi:hypothetical protein
MSDVKSRSEDLRRHREEVAEQEGQFARTRQDREHDAEQVAVQRANAAGQWWEEIDKRIAAAVAAEHRHMIELLTEMLIDIQATTEERIKDVRLALTEKIIDTLSNLRKAVEPDDQREHKTFQFARERERETDTAAIDLPNPLAARRDLN